MALTGTPAAQTATQANNDSDEFKAAKKAAAKRHSEKVKAEREKIYKRALAARDDLKKNGVFDKLSDETKKLFVDLCTEPGTRVGHSGPSFFTSVFGVEPKVGTVVTLKDVITKTFKGMDTMQASINKWAKKGIEVEINVNKQDMLATTYTLKKLAA